MNITGLTEVIPEGFTESSPPIYWWVEKNKDYSVPQGRLIQTFQEELICINRPGRDEY